MSDNEQVNRSNTGGGETVVIIETRWNNVSMTSQSVNRGDLGGRVRTSIYILVLMY